MNISVLLFATMLSAAMQGPSQQAEFDYAAPENIINVGVNGPTNTLMDSAVLIDSGIHLLPDRGSFTATYPNAAYLNFNCLGGCVAPLNIDGINFMSSFEGQIEKNLSPYEVPASQMLVHSAIQITFPQDMQAVEFDLAAVNQSSSGGVENLQSNNLPVTVVTLLNARGEMIGNSYVTQGQVGNVGFVGISSTQPFHSIIVQQPNTYFTLMNLAEVKQQNL